MNPLTTTIFMIAISACLSINARAEDHKGNNSLPASRVHFSTGAKVPVRSDRVTIAKNARWIIDHPDSVIILEGHCDERGSSEFNLELGDRRARAIYARMVELGVKPDSMTIISYGEEKPVLPSHSRAAWRENRRVEFIIR